jgi:hypothetical protein
MKWTTLLIPWSLAVGSRQKGFTTFAPADVDDGVELRLVDVLVVGERPQNSLGLDLGELESNRLRFHPDRSVPDDVSDRFDR